MARKKKRLPKDFDATLRSGDLDAAKAVFETTELDAHQDAYGPTALGMYDIPPALVGWLVAQGADIEAPDHYGHTPLWQHARIGNDPVVTALLDAGADLRSSRRPVLRAAAEGHKPATVRLLLARGADPLELEGGRSVLENALASCSNADLPRMAEITEVLLAAGTPTNERMRRRVEEIGKRFEFHRAGFNPDYLAETDAALTRLYELFDVTPVAPRRTHDGTSPITVTAATWPDQHQELWDTLVPSSGPAATAQGEAIRVTGRLAHEVLDNGGINWDQDFRTMARTVPTLLACGVPLPEAELAEATKLASAYGRNNPDEHVRRLSELAVRWVLANPDPLPAPEPAYKR
ncbi:ankyrin repeat domain-containing protein [Catenulispora sp. NF23]|uniref:Ankyrin repeat domain-containing protein n=1 Tax=Catenulispora pinistramenti TaxID=2705254 RepID=A0ABS5KM46_9ACTN|nr:ankyrin repeat domain-containing protein [Catenulispora pinistramenti]MBS2534281.1 ankyrin repeat domain-containing protein [Catenulispora pinistramenti]MBS2547094.1 ankyrin repeat domain-containing protein [Catenulispora pinistramenti]